MEKAETFRMAVSLVEKLIETKQVSLQPFSDSKAGVATEGYVSEIHAAIRRAWDKAQDDGTSTTGR